MCCIEMDLNQLCAVYVGAKIINILCVDVLITSSVPAATPVMISALRANAL